MQLYSYDCLPFVQMVNKRYVTI